MKAHKASGLLNRIITALTSMARAKTLALKSKTRALRTRLIIFSLLSNKKFLASSISHKLHGVLAHHRRHDKLKSHDDDDHDDGYDEHDGDCSGSVEEDQAVVLYRDSMAHQSVPEPTHTELVVDDIVGGCRYYGYGDDGEGDENKYPDLTHSMFDSEEDLELEEDPGGSVIDLVKNSKQEAGETFILEEEIDHMAELYIRRFHRQIRIQKQRSFKEFQEMLRRAL